MDSELIQTNISLYRTEHNKIKSKVKELKAKGENVSMAEIIRRAVNAYLPDPIVQEVQLAPNMPPLKIMQSSDNVVKENDPFESYNKLVREAAEKKFNDGE